MKTNPKTSFETIAEHEHWRLNFDSQSGSLAVVQEYSCGLDPRVVLLPLEQATSLARSILKLAGEGLVPSGESLESLGGVDKRTREVNVTTHAGDVLIEQPHLGETQSILISPGQVELLVVWLRRAAAEAVQRVNRPKPGKQAGDAKCSAISSLN